MILSEQCSSTLIQATTNSDVASCLSLGTLLPLATGSSNTSVVDPINNWLNSVCSAPVCTNETIAAFVNNVTAGCSSDLAALGVSSSDASSIIPTIQSAYPAVRQVACLQDGNTKCITQTLNNIQDMVGPLSPSNVMNIGASLGSSDIPSNVTCTNCIKEAYNIINQDFPGLLSDAQSDLQSQCGASFTDGQTPSGISQSSTDAQNDNNGAIQAGVAPAQVPQFVKLIDTLRIFAANARQAIKESVKDMIGSRICHRRSQNYGILLPSLLISWETEMSTHMLVHMRSVIFIAVATGAGLVSVNGQISLSSSCQTALRGLITNEDAACLNPSALLNFAVQGGGSVPDAVDAWLNGMCSQGSCTDESISNIITGVASGCSAELATFGLDASDISDNVVNIVQQVYPTVRQAMCLKDDNSEQLCLTELLTSVESVIGGLSLNDLSFLNLMGDVQQLLSSGLQNLACSNCVKAGFSVAAENFPSILSVAQPEVEALCGADFINGSTPASITETANPEVFAAQPPPTNGGIEEMTGPRMPEEGLAEWASRIKALQRQVDADEEAEHKRLEEEIAASRMARMRRSRGGGNGSRANSVDLGLNKESLASLKENDDNSSRDNPKPSSERQRDQSDALEKLVGRSNVTGVPMSRPNTKSTPSFPSPSNPSEPVSLAAFMGGRATGPRLNKHAPQQDAHDPTQFEQRSVRSITAPHPVFGRGGVAMPGMAGAADRSSVRSPDNGTSHGGASLSASTNAANGVRFNDERSASPQKSDVRERTHSNPTKPNVKPIATTSVPSKSYSPSSVHKDEELARIRDRTISTPSPSHDFRPPMSPPAFRNSVASRYTDALRERPVSPKKMGSRERTLSTPGVLKGSFSAPNHVDNEGDISRRPRTPSRSRATEEEDAMPTPNSPPQHSPVTTPSLAGPIRPQPRTSLGPQISTSPAPSPAFLKPPAQKEPTPSLSRLKGRGFVQNMVKASMEIESSSASSSLTSTPEKSGSGSRKVLERWQNQGSQSPPPISPPVSPKPNPLRKSRTIDSPTPATSSKPVKPDLLPKSQVPKPSVSFASTTETIPPESRKPEPKPKPKGLKPSVSFSNLPPSEGDRSKPPSVTNTGLGSATTLVVFKPEGDVAPFVGVSELGVKRDSTSLSARNIPVSSGKPLIHPTKERARKPKKQGSGLKHEGSSAPSTPPDISSERVIHAEAAERPQMEEVTSNVANGNGGRVLDRWANQPIIGVKPISSREQSFEADKPRVAGMIGRRALPGLATSAAGPDVATPTRPPAIPRTTSQEAALTTPFPSSESKQDQIAVEHRGPVPPRSRIPSTGNRPTVMDVVETMKAQSVSPEPQASVEERPRSPAAVVVPEQMPQPVPELASPLRAPALEKRKSSYERYSAIALPPLHEERTPESTPANTLARNALVSGSIIRDFPLPSQAETDTVKPAKEPSRLTHILNLGLAFVDEPLPQVDPDILTQSHLSAKRKDLDLNTISVEVMSITGNSSTAISNPSHIFYDSELLSIIHRAKSKTNGLVTTDVWVWYGRNCLTGENEEKKLEDLAKRYRTSPVIVRQYHEPPELLRILGDKLAIRQVRGVRVHWSADNTGMHVIRSKKDVIYIDEVDLTAKNLCSGFSYCLTILETVYVWYGIGSIAAERKAALQYGQSLSSNVVEMTEGENDGDEMFWIVLGDDEHARAHYWKWRPVAADTETKIWRVNTLAKDVVMPASSINPDEIAGAVHILDCVWELFVLVGRKVRGNRNDIRLALSVATQYSTTVSPARPFKPPVHVIVLPSQLPQDLKLHFRELNEDALVRPSSPKEGKRSHLFPQNANDVPDHMNLMPVEEASNHLRRKQWDAFALRDPSFLPVGLDPSQIN
ncbi:hypothetical protein D9758_001968 [Tetrapyrgos nigripes]|uniref:Uncharacterized protein n=1 Tax=Tetrapyrgos nigripes TaxID=182062 RepID=A0A8H5GTN6_9AGAR|nr:hypothetical protein D9758_001968 [Tetrapyrgos nigripes]